MQLKNNKIKKRVQSLKNNVLYSLFINYVRKKINLLRMRSFIPFLLMNINNRVDNI